MSGRESGLTPVRPHSGESYKEFEARIERVFESHPISWCCRPQEHGWDAGHWRYHPTTGRPICQRCHPVPGTPEFEREWAQLQRA